MKIKELLNLKNINKLKLNKMSDDLRSGYNATFNGDIEQQAKVVGDGYPYQGEARDVNRQYEIRADEPDPTYETTGYPSGKVKHQIQIEPLDYGFIVKVGCQTLAVESSERLLKGLTKYYANPNKAQKDWFEGTFFKD